MGKVISFVLFILVLMAAPLDKVDAQQNRTAIGVGYTHFSSNAGSRSNKAFQVIFSTMGLSHSVYVDIATNGVTGKGTPLYYVSDETTKADNVSILALNLGVVVPVRNLALYPRVGLAIESPIYEDAVGFNTWFVGEDNTNVLNVGVTVSVPIYEHINLYAGVGTYERVSIGFESVLSRP